MMNYIWVALVLIGVVFGAITGNLTEVQNAIFDFAESAVDIVFGLIGILCFFSGLMAVAEKAGLTEALGKLLKPVMSKLFPGIPADHPAASGIVMNLAANIMGLGNAATPFGLKAMADMQRLNKTKDIATDDMVMFLAINTSSVTLIPTTVIGLRSAAESANPAEVVGPIILATIISTATA
ncbi:MAG: nucleoside recognition protein, partial [Firmicutes bacterium]|nr:nucleoside recognition protein [Bacillota bacterium]